MSRLLLAVLAAFALEACAASHLLGELDAGRDAGSSSDAASVGDAGPDATATHDAGGGGGGGGVVCGPNVCRAGEICCSAACGVCAFPSECVDFGCAGAP